VPTEVSGTGLIFDPQKTSMSDDRKPGLRVGRSAYILPTDVVPANSDQNPPGPFWSQGSFCLWPHSLQAVFHPRPWSTSALTRLGAPHLLEHSWNNELPITDYNFRFQWNLPRARTTETGNFHELFICMTTKSLGAFPGKAANETLGSASIAAPSQAAIVVMSQFR